MTEMKYFRIARSVAPLVLLALFGSSFLLAQTSGGKPAVSPVAAARAARLRHGINASNWFAQVYDKRGYTKEHFQDWTTADDIALIKSMGFDHVRLSVNPQPMMPQHRPDEIPAEYLGYLDSGENDSGSRSGRGDRSPSGERLQGHAREGRQLRARVLRLLARAGATLFFLGHGARLL